MRITKWIGAASVTLIVGACGSDSGGSCPNLSGSYEVGGDCPTGSSCTLTQTGCSVTVSCTGANTLTGTVSNASISFGDSTTHCSGTVDRTTGKAPEASGSCTSSAGTCTFDATCTSGTCTTANEPMSNGSGGAAGSSAGGSGGGPAPDGGLDPTCESGVDAICTCIEASGDSCSDPQSLYDACVANDPAAAPVACFANYVSNDQIDCNAATNACIPHADGGSFMTCNPSTAPNDCTACVEGKCCTEWMGCTNSACAGDLGSPGEFVCMQTCFATGETSVATCTSMCAASGTTLDPQTQALLDCVVEADSGGTQACSTDCFGEMVQ